jgi:hypothetical protein
MNRNTNIAIMLTCWITGPYVIQYATAWLFGIHIPIESAIISMCWLILVQIGLMVYSLLGDDDE